MHSSLEVLPNSGYINDRRRRLSVLSDVNLHVDDFFEQQLRDFQNRQFVLPVLDSAVELWKYLRVQVSLSPEFTPFEMVCFKKILYH